MKKRRKRGAGGRFVSSKKRARRRGSRRRKRTAIIVASNPRRRRRSYSRRRSSRKRRRSILAMPRSNPRRRRTVRRRRRNPSGGELSGGQIALAGVVGGTSFATATILVPRILPQQIHTSPVLYGGGMVALGALVMWLLRRYPVIAIAGGVPVMGAGIYTAAIGWLAKNGQQAQQPQAGQGTQPAANLGAVVLEDLQQMQMGAVYPQMGAVYPSMGAVEALVGTGDYSRTPAPSMAMYAGAI